MDAKATGLSESTYQRLVERVKELKEKGKAQVTGVCERCEALAKRVEELERERNEALYEAKAVDLYRGHHVRLSEWMGDKDGEVWRSSHDLSERVIQRTEAAEAEVARLREALERDHRDKTYDGTCYVCAKESAEAKLAEARAEVARLREALGSISKNTCCGSCQEAALVARAVLKGD